MQGMVGTWAMEICHQTFNFEQNLSKIFTLGTCSCNIHPNIHVPAVEQGSVLPQTLLQVGMGSRHEVLADPSPRRLETVSAPQGQWVTLAGRRQHEKHGPE